MYDIMVDLETLGTEPGCKILSIGAVRFSPAGLHERFYVEIERGLQETLQENNDTLHWWMGQPAEVRDRLFVCSKDKSSLADGLRLFTNWLVDIDSLAVVNNEFRIWGNGADFDQPILVAAYKACGIPPPWKFTRNRCYRTLKNLGMTIRHARDEATKHNALSDAIYQAEHAIKILDNLRLWEYCKPRLSAAL